MTFHTIKHCVLYTAALLFPSQKQTRSLSLQIKCIAICNTITRDGRQLLLVQHKQAAPRGCCILHACPIN